MLWKNKNTMQSRFFLFCFFCKSYQTIIELKLKLVPSTPFNKVRIDASKYFCNMLKCSWLMYNRSISSLSILLCKSMCGLVQQLNNSNFWVGCYHLQHAMFKKYIHNSYENPETSVHTGTKQNTHLWRPH